MVDHLLSMGNWPFKIKIKDHPFNQLHEVWYIPLTWPEHTEHTLHKKKQVALERKFILQPLI